MFTSRLAAPARPASSQPPFPGFGPCGVPPPPTACHPHCTTRTYLHNTFVPWPRWLLGAREVVVADPDLRACSIRRSSLLIPPLQSHPVEPSATTAADTATLTPDARSFTADAPPSTARSQSSASGGHSHPEASSSGSSILSRLLPTFPINVSVPGTTPDTPAPPTSSSLDPPTPASTSCRAYGRIPSILWAAGAAALLMLVVLAVVLPITLRKPSSPGPAFQLHSSAAACTANGPAVVGYLEVPQLFHQASTAPDTHAGRAVAEWLLDDGPGEASRATLAVVPIGPHQHVQVRFANTLMGTHAVAAAEAFRHPWLCRDSCICASTSRTRFCCTS